MRQAKDIYETQIVKTEGWKSSGTQRAIFARAAPSPAVRPCRKMAGFCSPATYSHVATSSKARQACATRFVKKPELVHAQSAAGAHCWVGEARVRAKGVRVELLRSAAVRVLTTSGATALRQPRQPPGTRPAAAQARPRTIPGRAAHSVVNMSKSSALRFYPQPTASTQSPLLLPWRFGSHNRRQSRTPNKPRS